MDSQTNESPVAEAVVDADQDILDSKSVEAPACGDASTDLEDPVPSTSGSAGPVSRRPRWAGRAPGVLLLLGAFGAGSVIVKLVKAFRRQQQELSEACKQLRSAQEQLAAKERSLDQNETRRKAEQELRAGELSQQVADAHRELAAAREMCRQAAAKLEQSMSDLSVTETELRAARTQLNTASRDLALTHAQLEATEGELGLTRSQNELMKREVDILRRQLREAGQQLESYIRVSRGRKNDGLEDDTRLGLSGLGRGDYEDDVAAATADWGY